VDGADAVAVADGADRIDRPVPASRLRQHLVLRLLNLPQQLCQRLPPIRRQRLRLLRVSRHRGALANRHAQLSSRAQDAVDPAGDAADSAAEEASAKVDRVADRVAASFPTALTGLF
jgi:hypothetical protein